MLKLVQILVGWGEFIRTNYEGDENEILALRKWAETYIHEENFKVGNVCEESPEMKEYYKTRLCLEFEDMNTFFFVLCYWSQHSMDIKTDVNLSLKTDKPPIHNLPSCYIKHQALMDGKYWDKIKQLVKG